MIITETATINGIDYIYSKSSDGHYIYCDDDTKNNNKTLYQEAYDPIDTNRIYKESDVVIESEVITDEEAFKILTGE